MREIPLTQGKVAFVDNEDYERVMQYKWYARYQYGRWIAMRSNRERKAILLHRFVMNARDGLVIDHIDHNCLNDQKYNLRECTTAQNLANMRKSPNKSSKYKGVTWRRDRWAAQISIRDQTTFLGSFALEEDAARCYNEAALTLRGEFALLNKVTP